MSTAVAEKWVDMARIDVHGPVAVAPEFRLDPNQRAAVLRLEDAIKKLPQVMCPVKHYFAPGVYVREMFIPAGAVLTGRIHLQDGVTMLLQGALRFTDGGEVKDVRAPATWVSPAGAKKAGFALEDSIISGCFANPTDERDLAKIVDLFTCDTHEEFVAHQKGLPHVRD